MRDQRPFGPMQAGQLARKESPPRQLEDDELDHLPGDGRECRAVGNKADFEAEGLLGDLEGDARAARLELLEQLEEESVPLEELRRAIEEDRLALLPVERVLSGVYRYTPEEVAEKAGISLKFFQQEIRAFGLPVPQPGERTLTDADLDAATRAKAFLDAGLPEEGMIEVARVIGMSMARLAEANMVLIPDVYMRAGDTERDLGRRYADMAKLMSPVLSRTMNYVFEEHLREFVKQAVVSNAELASGELPGASEVTIAFADLVGFTMLGEHLEVDQIGEVSGRLVEHATSIVEAPVRLVKMIGDAAMFVSKEPDAVVDAALRLVEAVEADENLPAMRAGVARGEALARAGDWYGRPVNLASRITDFAREGTVVCDKQAKKGIEEAGDGFDFSFAGERHFKGIKGEVTVFRVKRPKNG